MLLASNQFTVILCAFSLFMPGWYLFSLFSDFPPGRQKRWVRAAFMGWPLLFKLPRVFFVWTILSKVSNEEKKFKGILSGKCRVFLSFASSDWLSRMLILRTDADLEFLLSEAAGSNVRRQKLPSDVLRFCIDTHTDTHTRRCKDWLIFTPNWLLWSCLASFPCSH